MAELVLKLSRPAPDASCERSIRGQSPNTAVRACACLCSYRVCATSPLAGVTSAGPAFPGSGFGGSSRPLSGSRRPEVRRSQTRLHRSGAPFLAGGSGLIRRLQSRQSGGASRALRASFPVSGPQAGPSGREAGSPGSGACLSSSASTGASPLRRCSRRVPRHAWPVPIRHHEKTP